MNLIPTLGKQRQTLAAAYTSWLSGEQQADELLEKFWPWEGEAVGSSSTARAGDSELSLSEEIRLDDYYYARGGAENTFERDSRISARVPWASARSILFSG